MWESEKIRACLERKFYIGYLKRGSCNQSDFPFDHINKIKSLKKKLYPENSISIYIIT